MVFRIGLFLHGVERCRRCPIKKGGFAIGQIVKGAHFLVTVPSKTSTGLPRPSEAFKGLKRPLKAFKDCY